MHYDGECHACKTDLSNPKRQKVATLERFNYQALHTLFMCNELYECYFYSNSQIPSPKEGRIKMSTTTRANTKIYQFEIWWKVTYSIMKMNSLCSKTIVPDFEEFQ